jgi:hypothetical protein
MSLFESASLVVTPNGTKASKLYAIKPTDGSGDLSVTRATTATRVNSAGLIESVAVNVPRLDYTNSSCPSILVEPQRTNLSTHSENMGDASWDKYRIIVTDNAINSPSGILNADKIIATAQNGTHEIVKVSVVNTSTVYTRSIFAKVGEYNTFEMYEVNSSKGQIFNLATKTISAPQTSGVSAATSSKIEDYGNGWLKCSITYTSVGLADILVIGLYNGSLIFTGNGTNGLYLWGAQLEAGSYATSYIPTVASTVTRNADVISKTGISSLIGQTEGTIFFDGKINALPVDGYLFSVQKASSNFVVGIGSQGNNIYAQSYNGSANLFFETTSYTLGSRVKVAFAYKAGSYAFYINGVQIATGSNATTIPACDAISFNSLWGNFNISLSFYSAAALWKTRLTNAELAELTTL